MSGQPCSKTIRLGGTRGVWFGEAMGVSWLRLASQRPLCVQDRHPSPCSALPKGLVRIKPVDVGCEGPGTEVASSRKPARTEVTVWSALHVPRDASGVTHHLQCSRPMLYGRCPELRIRRMVNSSLLERVGNVSRAVKPTRAGPLVALAGGAW